MGDSTGLEALVRCPAFQTMAEGRSTATVQVMPDFGDVDQICLEMNLMNVPEICLVTGQGAIRQRA